MKFDQTIINELVDSLKNVPFIKNNQSVMDITPAYYFDGEYKAEYTLDNLELSIQISINFGLDWETATAQISIEGSHFHVDDLDDLHFVNGQWLTESDNRDNWLNDIETELNLWKHTIPLLEKMYMNRIHALSKII